MEPASTIISFLGGPTVVAQIVGVHRTRVHGWMREKAKGGTGGTIPLKHIPTLIAASASAERPLAAEDFMPRAPAPLPKTRGSNAGVAAS